MSNNRFAINGKSIKIGTITESGVVTLSDFKPSQELVFRQPEGASFEPIHVDNLATSFTFTTTEQAGSFFGAFTEPRLIAKISTKKGDLYAPVKSYENNTLTLDIPEDEDEMWKQSDYWMQAEEQGKRINETTQGASE